MKCPNCNSENIQMQAKTRKNPIMLGCVLGLGGIGLMFLGVIGLILGAVAGLILGAIIKNIMPDSYETVGTCQSCGYTLQVKNQVPVRTTSPLFCTESESNLIVSRENASCGSIIGLQLTVDGKDSFVLANASTIYLKLDCASHVVSFEQLKGIGKKNRKGSVVINLADGTKQHIRMIFTPKGIDVQVN